MVLTIKQLFEEPLIVKAVIDRAIALGLDKIYWQEGMVFEETKSRVFKSYIGAVLGVTKGSVIDRNAKKPLRDRSMLGSGTLEVIPMGDKYQLDNDRLDMLRSLVKKFNAAASADQAKVMTDIINYIVDDMRQLILAPHKLMDCIYGDLRSTGKSEIASEKGVTLLDMEIPVNKITPAVSEKTNFIKYLKAKLEELKTSYGKYAYMEMSRSTFNQNIVGSADFSSTFKMILGSQAEFTLNSGLITSEMASQVFTGIGLPAIKICEDMVQNGDGTYTQVFKDNRISLFHSTNHGKVRWYGGLEADDPVPGKTYTPQEGGMWISSERTEEGRFLEYGCEWVPEIANPNKITIFDLDTMNA